MYSTDYLPSNLQLINMNSFKNRKSYPLNLRELVIDTFIVDKNDIVVELPSSEQSRPGQQRAKKRTKSHGSILGRHTHGYGCWVRPWIYGH